MTTVPVVVHVNEPLDESAMMRLTTIFRDISGVIRFEKTACQHLLRINYEPQTVAATYLLEAVTALGHHAQLVGL